MDMLLIFGMLINATFVGGFFALLVMGLCLWLDTGIFAMLMLMLGTFSTGFILRWNHIVAQANKATLAQRNWERNNDN